MLNSSLIVWFSQFQFRNRLFIKNDVKYDDEFEITFIRRPKKNH